MGEFKDNISSRRNEALEPQRSGSPEITAKSGFIGFLKSVREGLLKRARAVLPAAVLAMSPAIGSCANVVEVEGQDGDVQGAQVGNQNENVMDRAVTVSCGGTPESAHWEFQGNFPVDFHSTVFADGVMVDSRDVHVDTSKSYQQFALSGALPVNVQNINVQTSDMAGNDISPADDPQSEGMLGKSDCKPSVQY